MTIQLSFEMSEGGAEALETFLTDAGFASLQDFLEPKVGDYMTRFARTLESSWPSNWANRARRPLDYQPRLCLSCLAPIDRWAHGRRQYCSDGCLPRESVSVESERRAGLSCPWLNSVGGARPLPGT
jgi:hypothetical protein